jgi:hypothetical protein
VDELIKENIAKKDEAEVLKKGEEAYQKGHDDAAKNVEDLVMNMKVRAEYEGEG